MNNRSRATLITGCSSGIGRATALRLAAAGWPVWATARHIETLEPLAAAGCRTVCLDVTDDSALQAVVAAIEAEHGAVGILVNNAGYGLQGPLEDTEMSDVRRQFEVNLFSPMRLIQLALPGMRRHGWGRVINVSSMGGRITFPGGSAYHGSKYALEAVSDVLRWEVAPFGVSVTLVEPGPTLTGYGAAATETLPAREDAGPYARLTESIRTALAITFGGAGLPGASKPEEVAAAIEAAITTEPAPTRIVVGALAQSLIELRRSSTDESWDQTMETMYERPGAALAVSGAETGAESDHDT